MAYPNSGRIQWCRRTLVGLCVGLACNLAGAEVSQAVLENAEALLKSGKAEETYRLLEPLELDGAGDPVYDYLLGTAALDSNRPSKASFVYERILAVAPGFLGVRADMGRAYFALGDFGRAKIEFESVLASQSLPPDLRRTVEQYAKAAQARSKNQRTVVSGYAEAGIGADTNIGSATALSSLNLPAIGLYAPAPPTGQKTADSFSIVSVGAEINHQLTDQWGLYGGADYRRRAYQLYTESGYATLDSRAGISYSGGNWLLRAGLTAGQYSLNQIRLRDTVGATLDWRITSDNASQWSLGGSYTDATYTDPATANQNTQTSALTAGWLTSFSDGSAVFSLTGMLGMEKGVGGRDDGDRRFYGPRLTLQKNFNEKLGGYASLGATFSRYSGTNTLYMLQREESLYDLALGVTWSGGSGFSLRPQFSAIRNASNAPLYAYDKNDFSINVRFDF